MSSLRTVLLSCALLVAALPARAEDTTELESLLDEPVVSTASKIPETGRTAPASSRVVTADEIRALGMHTLSEAISFLAQGVYEDMDPISPALGSRGVFVAEDVHFLALVNGHAMNDPYRGGASLDTVTSVPLEIVDRIEVILGPGSVLYGSNATFGVINVITKSARDFSGVRAGVEADRYTVRPYVGVGEELRLFGARGEITYELQYLRRRGPYLVLGPQNAGLDPGTGQPTRFGRDPVGNGIWGGTAWTDNVVDVPSGHLRMRLGEFTLDVNAAVSRTPALDSPSDYNGNTVVDQRRVALDLAHTHVFSTRVQLLTRLYADTMDSSAALDVSRTPECPYGGAGITCRIDNRYGTRWGGVEVQPQIDWFADGRFVTLLGVDARARWARAKTDELNVADGRPLLPSIGLVDRTDGTVGAYAQQTWQPARWVWLNGGGRFDYDARFDPVVSPRAAAGFGLWDGGSLKLIYSKAFRAPTFEESYFSHPLQPPPDPLRPEDIDTREVVLSQALGVHRITLSGFHTTFEDLIVRKRLTSDEAAALVQSGRSLITPQYQERNVDELTSYGFTAGIDGSFAGATLRYGASVTSARSHDQDGDDGDEAPHVFGNAHLTWRPSPAVPTFGLATRWMSAAQVPNATTGAFPGIPKAPPILELRGTVSGDTHLVPGLAYRATLSYVFNGGTASVVGPVQQETATQHAPERLPLERVRAWLGLEQRF